MLEMFYILNLDYRLIVRNIKGLRHRVEKIYVLQNQNCGKNSVSVHVSDLRCLASALQAYRLSHYRTIALSYYRTIALSLETYLL